MKRKTIHVALIFLLATPTLAWSAQEARDQIMITGGYTPEPLQRKVGEKLVSQYPHYKPPLIEPNSASLGFKAFCAGVGLETPDITGATRRIRPAEMALCQENGVKEIVEIKVANDALILAQAPEGALTRLTRQELFLAVAKEVPDPKDSTKMIANPYKNWNEINPNYPNLKIQIMAPDPILGYYQSYADLLIRAGCEQLDAVKALEAKAREEFCKSFRKDDAYTEYKDVNAALKEIKNRREVLSIIMFSRAFKEGFKPITLDGIEPTLVSVSREIYSLTLPILLYIKKAHVDLVPGLKDYLAEFTSERAMGTMGYFYDLGAIPLPLRERLQVRKDAQELKALPTL